MEQPLAYRVRIQTPFDKAIEIVMETLRRVGFGVPAQIEVKHN
jgi:uncharacterized protein (DUF302 family)